MKTLLKNARILKMDDTPIFIGDILIEDSRITKIAPSINEEADIVRDCHKNVIMPGFKNAHSHNAMTFLRSKTDGSNLQDWLFKTVLPREELLTPENVYHFAKVAFLECISGGITACFDQYYFRLMTAKAAEEMGFRLVLMGVYNTSYEALVEEFHQYNDKEDSLVSFLLGIHAEYTVTEDELKQMVTAVHDLKVPFYSHISETKKEVEECIARRGMGPVEFFNSLGLFDYGGGGYHCVYFSDKEAQIFKEKNLSVVSCPGSNTKLSSGVIPLVKYHKMGINVALGTDGPASNNCLNMFKEMALTFSLQNLNTGNPACLKSYDILKMATVNGAKAMGLKDCDILEVGKKADLIEIDLSRPNMQPLNDIVTNIVYSGSKDIIKMTMINGKILYEDGKFFINEDIKKIYDDCQRDSEDLEARYLAGLNH